MLWGRKRFSPNGCVMVSVWSEGKESWVNGDKWDHDQGLGLFCTAAVGPHLVTERPFIAAVLPPKRKTWGRRRAKAARSRAYRAQSTSQKDVTASKSHQTPIQSSKGDWRGLDAETKAQGSRGRCYFSSRGIRNRASASLDVHKAAHGFPPRPSNAA